MNCIIGADNLSCKLLVEFVAKSSSVNLFGTFSDSVSLKDQLSRRHDIDLLFIDFEILGMDCLDFISNLDYKPNIIILSSSDQSALKTFDISFIDYLLKPVSYSGFCRAIDKAKRYYSRKDINNSADNEIFIKYESSYIKIKLKDIIYIEAFENTITLTTYDKKFDIHFTMKDLGNQLPSEIFIRVHRSFIVNKRMIRTINEDSLDLAIGNTLKNFPVGRTFKDLLLNEINVMAK
jgi:DNA-binding LytR/AlgR family response regulator